MGTEPVGTVCCAFPSLQLERSERERQLELSVLMTNYTIARQQVRSCALETPEPFMYLFSRLQLTSVKQCLFTNYADVIDGLNTQNFWARRNDKAFQAQTSRMDSWLV